METSWVFKREMMLTLMKHGAAAVKVRGQKSGDSNDKIGSGDIEHNCIYFVTPTKNTTLAWTRLLKGAAVPRPAYRHLTF